MNEPSPAVGSFPDHIGAGYDYTRADSPLARYYLQTPHVLAVLIIAGVASFTSLLPLWASDVWAHLRFGDWMIQHRAIPLEEPFSPWWDGRIPFTQFYTFTQVLMALVYRLGPSVVGGDDLNQMAAGIDGLRTLHGLLSGLKFTLLWFAFRRLGASPSTALAGLVLCLLLTSVNLAVFRPQVFAEVYFVLLLLFFSSSTVRWSALVLVPLLLALWANSHGSYLLALGFLAVQGVSQLARVVVGKCRWSDSQNLKLLLILVGSIIAVGLLNPYGFSYFSRTLALTSSPALAAGVTEWQPLRFQWAMDWHWILVGSLLLVAVTLYRSPRAMPLNHLLMLILMAAGMALQQRFNVWWALFLPWVLVPHWTALQQLQSPESAGEPAPVASFRKTLLALAIAVAMFMWSTPASWIIYGSPTPVRIGASSGTPWEVARVLKNPAESNDSNNAEWAEFLRRTIQTYYPGGRFCGSVFASPMKGDFLLWALAPEIPTTYTHMHLFPPELWADLGIVASAAPGWQYVLERYGVNLLIFEPNMSQKLRDELKDSPEWVIVLDETDDQTKIIPFNRMLIAIRVKPLQPTFQIREGR